MRRGRGHPGGHPPSMTEASGGLLQNHARCQPEVLVGISGAAAHGRLFLGDNILVLMFLSR